MPSTARTLGRWLAAGFAACALGAPGLGVETGFDGDAIPVNSFLSGPQDHPDVAVAPDGSFVIVWSSFDQISPGWDIFGRRFGADGSPLGNEFQVNVFDSGDQRNPAVAIAGDGRFAVVWESAGQDGDGLGVFGRRFAADGSPAGPEFPLHTSVVRAQQSPAIAMGASGDFVVTWESNHLASSDWRVLARRFNADGTPASAEIPVEAAQDCGFQTPEPDVALDGGGAFTVAWRRIPSCFGIAGEVLARKYDASGNPLGAEFSVGAGEAMTAPTIAANALGEFVVGWDGYVYPQAPNELYVPFATKRAPGGSAVGNEWRATGSDRYEQNPSTAIDGPGRYIVVWDALPGGGVRAQRFDQAAQPIASEFWVATGNRNLGPAAASSNSAGITVVAWQFDPNGADPGDILARRICANLTMSGTPGGLACEGSALVQTVSAIGEAPLAYRWRRNGVDLVDGSRISGSGTPTLRIDPVTPGDAGSYDCVVTDGCAGVQTAVSPSGALTVDDLPAVVTGLLLSKAADGADLQLNWANVVGADDYVVRQDVLASGGFETVTGTAASGTTGLSLAMPSGDAFYLVAGRDADCGEGPR